MSALAPAFFGPGLGNGVANEKDSHNGTLDERRLGDQPVALSGSVAASRSRVIRTRAFRFRFPDEIIRGSGFANNDDLIPDPAISQTRAKLLSDQAIAVIRFRHSSIQATY